MIDIKMFASLQKASKVSFAKQKQIVKKVMGGQTVLCSKCKQPLFLFTPEHDQVPGIRCNQGCTDLQLDFA
jgi:hypothetical protein